jgi:hypothetical protein
VAGQVSRKECLVVAGQERMSSCGWAGKQERCLVVAGQVRMSSCGRSGKQERMQGFF